MDKNETPALVGSNDLLGPLDQCDTCKFWLPLVHEYGKCRRNPPVADHVQLCFVRDMGFADEDSAGDKTHWWAQPRTENCDWCGEYVRGPNVGAKAPT